RPSWQADPRQPAARRAGENGAADQPELSGRRASAVHAAHTAPQPASASGWAGVSPSGPRACASRYTGEYHCGLRAECPSGTPKMISRKTQALLLALALMAGAQAQDRNLDLKLPLKNSSVRFAVIGDSGTGNKEQYEVARQMDAYRQSVKFDFVIMLGDNIYGGHSPRDFAQKFELPYKPLLDAGVKFYASLGNHDDPNIERLYKPFNMNGERYHTFRRGDVQFFALDSNYMDAKQLSWLEDNLRSSHARWKICYFHHPLYNDGKSHGPDLDLRSQLTPL